ncbi:MAG: hypothetical protein NNA22_08415 [Nitrospira sp.]|nr:hypothetical protein [Nitrospira sp.]
MTLVPLSSNVPACSVAGLSLFFSLLATGCSALFVGYGEPVTHKSTKGTVYLKPIIDRSFTADHPAVIDHATLLTPIQGLMAEDVTDSSADMPVDGGKPMRIFSDEDAEFLAPLLADGLSRAKPNHIVGFTVSPSAGSGAEPAAGIIYRYHDSLHITISTTGGRKLLGFQPRMAARVERAPAYTTNWMPGTQTAVIDLRRLVGDTRQGTSVHLQQLGLQ